MLKIKVCAQDVVQDSRKNTDWESGRFVVSGGLWYPQLSGKGWPRWSPGPRQLKGFTAARADISIYLALSLHEADAVGSRV